MTDQPAQQQAPQRVVSENDDARALIETLRGVAKGVADLGNEVEAAERKAEQAHEEAEDAIGAANESKAESEEAIGELAEWRLLLEDYRRGIVDRDELLEKTVGHG